jgi:molybdenum cofactor cytidylyltransferase
VAQPGLRDLNRPLRPVVVILAAGLGERFRQAGGAHDKLSAPLGPQRVRDHVVAAAQASGLPWHVVEREHTQHLSAQGMGASIATGVAATANAPGWLILPADLPLVQADSLRRVAEALAQHAVVAPWVQGQRGHPVGFGAVCREALLALSGDQGAKSVMQAHAPWRLDLDDLGCILDVDTPDALAEAERLWRSRA